MAATVNLGGQPGAIAVNPVTDKIYVLTLDVLNIDNGSVTVIDGLTNEVSTVTDPNAVGPMALAVNPVTNKVYVANFGETPYAADNSSVTVIDGATNAIESAGINGGLYIGIIANSVTNRVYLFSNYVHGYGGGFLVLDGATDMVAGNGGFQGLCNAFAADPQRKRIYVGGYPAKDVYVFDEAANVVASIAIGGSPAGIAVNSVTDKIYVSILGTNNVAVIDGTTDAIATVTDPNAGGPAGIAVNPVTNKVYVGNALTNNVTVIDGATDATTTVELVDAPGAIAVNSVTNKVYVSIGGSNSVTVIDGATNATVTLSDPNAIGPSEVAINPVTNKVYVVNERSNNVTVINGATKAVEPSPFEPQSQTVNVGEAVVFRALANGTPSSSYQWFFNGVPISDGGGISGSTTPTLYLGLGAVQADTGVYNCLTTSSTGTASSNAAVLNVVSSSAPGRIVNLSSRAFVGSNGDIMITGFVVGGSGSKDLIIRGIGPALAGFGLSGTLVDPVISLYDSANPANLITYDSGWQNPPSAPTGPWAGKVSPAGATAADFSQVGAFGLAPESSDSAVRIALPTGVYTSQVSGAFISQIARSPTGTGVALAEVYDADSGVPTAQLVDISSRAFVGTGSNILIAGFVIEGSTSQTVLIRASGPALAGFGVTGMLPDPRLQLFDSNQNLIASSLGWGGSPQIAGAAATSGAFPWSDPSSNDAAVLITLPPGSYTAQVSGQSGDTGVALVEIYALPPFTN